MRFTESALGVRMLRFEAVKHNPADSGEMRDSVV
jgi:hypothetical protein